MEERQFTNVERFAKRMPPGYPFLAIELRDKNGKLIGKKFYPHCHHQKKKLHKKIKGSKVDYHFMKCTDCGMMEIIQISQETGLWINPRKTI